MKGLVLVFVVFSSPHLLCYFHLIFLYFDVDFINRNIYVPISLCLGVEFFFIVSKFLVRRRCGVE